MQNQLWAKQEQVAHPGIQPPAQADRKSSNRCGQENQGGSKRMKFGRTPGKRGCSQTADGRRNAIKPGALEVSVQGVNREDLVHYKPEVPEQKEDLDERGDVQ